MRKLRLQIEFDDYRNIWHPYIYSRYSPLKHINSNYYEKIAEQFNYGLLLPRNLSHLFVEVRMRSAVTSLQDNSIYVELLPADLRLYK